MAEEQKTTAAAEAPTTTAPDATETTATEPQTTTNNADENTAAPAEGKDDEKKDAETKAEDVEAAGAEATTEVTGPDGDKTEAAELPSTATPASAKSKRKSSAGVPEHKNKKVNKRKSMVNLLTDAAPGEYYFAKLKGYPPWPSIICDEEMLPLSLLEKRPVSALRADGTLREDYQEGGKNARDRTYGVMFLGTNEFAWIVNTSLEPISPGDCAEDKVNNKMTKALKGAYQIADERHDLDYFKELLREHQEQEKERAEAEAQKQLESEQKSAKKQERLDSAAASKTTKEKKEKRKSKSKATASDEDEMEVDEAEEKPSKKRKKEADSEGEGAKPKKTPKSIKITAKSSAGKTPNGDSAKKMSKKKVVKPAEKEEEKEVLTEEQRMERREKAVLYLRHRLQKGFLSRDQTPKEEEMASMSEFFTQLEGYTDLEAQIIRTTKINKVLKGIVKLAWVPKEDEHHFKKRSNDILAHWNKALDNSKDDTPAGAKETPAADGETATEGEAKTNGHATEKVDEGDKEAPKEDPEATAENAKAAGDAGEDKDVTMADAKEDKPAEAAAEAGAEQTEAVAETDAEAETKSA